MRQGGAVGYSEVDKEVRGDDWTTLTSFAIVPFIECLESECLDARCERIRKRREERC